MLLDVFMKVFRVPEFIRPYLHFFVAEREIRLITVLQDGSLTGEEVARLWREPHQEVSGFLEQAYRRHVVDRAYKDGIALYSAGDFYGRLDNYSKFGNYHVVPLKIRHMLDQWCFEEYLQRNGYFSKITGGQPDYGNCHNEWVLLLPEVEAMIDAAGRIGVVPCNCKMMAGNCGHSREICLLFDDTITDRTAGRELTREEARELVRRLDREGLMHTGGPHDWQEKGPGVVCNCCSCCCYPFRAASKLGTKGKWPRSRYVASYNRDKCRLCGLCAGRCQFGAFYFDGNGLDQGGKIRKNVVFNSELCWGCGLCANSCPGGAIVMEKVRDDTGQQQ